MAETATATEGAVFAAGVMEAVTESVRDAIDRAVRAERAACARIVLEAIDEDTLEDIAGQIMRRK